jgi:ribosomal protein L37AE/L43A
VLLCDKCLERGLEVIRLHVRTWQRDNNRVMICGGCYRPILTLDTHLEVKRLNPSG